MQVACARAYLYLRQRMAVVPQSFSPRNVTVIYTKSEIDRRKGDFTSKVDVDEQKKEGEATLT